jgi:hypothetical protein
VRWGLECARDIEDTTIFKECENPTGDGALCLRGIPLNPEYGTAEAGKTSRNLLEFHGASDER